MTRGYNFAPLMQGLDSVQRQMNLNDQRDMQYERMEEDDYRFGVQQDAREKAAKQALANQNAMYAHRDKVFDADQAHRNAMLGLQKMRIGQGSPNADLKREKLKAEIAKLKNGDPLKAAKVQLLQQLMGGGQPQPGNPAAPQQPKFLPQSNTIDGAQDPNLIRTAGSNPTQARSPLSNLTPTQRQALGLNLVVPGAGNAILNADKEAGFGKATKNKIEGQIFNTAEQSARLDGIRKSFKPEFLTYGGGLKASWLGLLEKARGKGAINDSDRKYLTEFTQFKQEAWDNLNRYIKEITGAQMSEPEAARLMRAMPNPGKNFWDGDSPTEFKSKMDQTIANLKLAAARYTYLRSARMSGGKNISLGQMRGIINKRAGQILHELKKANPGVDASLIQAQADMVVKQEFGI